MKVKNIMFSGFAAAILMGTVSANAATPFKIASQAYVDQQINNLSGANGAISEVSSAVDTLADQIAGENESLTGFESGTTVVGAINDLKEDVDVLNGSASTAGSVAEAKAAADAAQGDVDTLAGNVGDTSGLETTFGAGNDTVVEALGALKTSVDSKADATETTNALAGKVNISDKATTIGTVATASDDKWATEKAVATVVQGITGGSGTVSQQIEAVVGNLGTNTTSGNENTVEEALALKANAADVATDAEVAALLGSGVTTSSTVTQQLQAKQDSLSNDQINAIAKLLAAGYNACVNDSNGSGHCVLTAAKNGGLEWIDVTSPFEITD